MSTILVGIDASERSQDAVAFARALALASGARVVVASAFPYEDVPSGAANAEFRTALQQDAEATVRQALPLLEGVDRDRIGVRVVARTSPAHALHDLAVDEHADLIVVGSSHRGRLGRVLPGSTAERLLHGAPCAVAVVPSGHREAEQKIRRIGVAHDGSEEAAGALRAAIDAARALDAELRVIHAFTEIYAVAAPLPLPGSDFLEMRATMERLAREGLERAVAGLPADVRGEGVFLHGEPAPELAKASSELDLLVTGSRRYGPVRSVLLGGVNGPLLREAECPVVVVPRGVEAPLGSLFATREQTVG